MKNLSTKKIEKYSRQILMKEVGIDGQKKICRSSICIIGCGGLGTSAAQYLTMTGVENITLIDYDLVELSNINRQTLFFEEDIGLPKIEVLKKKLQKINPESNIKVKNVKLTKNNIRKIIGKIPFILDCTDNFKTRYLINEFCFHEKKILISAALQNFDIQVSAFAAWKKKKFPCYHCLFPQKIITNPNNCDTLGVIAYSAGIGGLLQATITVNILISNSTQFFSQLILFDCLNTTFKKIKTFKNQSCKVCKSLN